jgi:hypothetical protein
MVCFQTKKSQSGYISEGLGMENVVIVFDHLEYFFAIWYNLWPFGIICAHLVYYSHFGMFGPRKIWQLWVQDDRGKCFVLFFPPFYLAYNFCCFLWKWIRDTTPIGITEPTPPAFAYLCKKICPMPFHISHFKPYIHQCTLCHCTYTTALLRFPFKILTPWRDSNPNLRSSGGWDDQFATP